jgi:hypothetical protein
MSSDKVQQLQQHSLECLAPHDESSLPSPSRFKSLVRDLRQKLNVDLSSPDCIDGADASLQQTMDDVACLSRLLRMSEAALCVERSSSQEAQSTISNLQQQLETVSKEYSAHREVALEIKSELQRSKECNIRLEQDVNALREALGKSEGYRKEYAKSKKSEILDLQSKLDAAAAEAALQDAAHQRTRALLLSEVESRSNAVSSIERVEASYAELQAQHQKLQDKCQFQHQQLQVSITHCSCFNQSAF